MKLPIPQAVFVNVLAVVLLYFDILGGYVLFYGMPILILLVSAIYQIRNVSLGRKGYYQSLIIPGSYLVIVPSYLASFPPSFSVFSAWVILFQALGTFAITAIINLLVGGNKRD